jgi:toxin FitB
VADVLVDTDVFVDHLRGHRALAIGSDRVCYSTITRAELFAGRSTEEATVRLLLAPFAEVAVDRAIAERAGRLRREGSILLPDALIAATVLERGLTLVTRNVADFRPIPDLVVRQPA